MSLPGMLALRGPHRINLASQVHFNLPFIGNYLRSYQEFDLFLEFEFVLSVLLGFVAVLNHRYVTP